MITLSSFQQSVLLTNLFFITGISIAKTLGSPTDHETKAVLEQCLNNATLYSNYGDGTPGFGFGQCPHLIECVLSSSSEANKAGMSAGASIAALIPTMLALIGAGPSELVRLAFLSPLRAIATCLFGIGLPSNLFAQIQQQPSHSHSGSDESTRPTISFPLGVDRSGVMHMAFPISAPRHPRRRLTAIFRIALDLLILGLAALMLWRNWRVGTMTMVTWRCEYRWLLFFWPVACVGWWVLAVGSLIGMARKIDVYRESDGADMGWRALFGLNDSALGGGRRERDLDGGGPLVQHQQLNPSETKPDHTSFLPADDMAPDRLILRITLRSPHLHRWWDTAINAIAVGIYLYATFVLSSTLFLTGYEAMLYAVGMTLSLSAIRIMTALL